MNLLLAASLISLAQAPVAMAAPCEPVADLLDFIAAHTDYAPPSICPRVERDDVLPADAALRAQAGAYFPITGHIALAADLDLTTAYG